MSTAKHKLFGHTSIYMFGDILRYSVSVVMIPIYTRYLTPEDYGIVELLSMLVDVSSIIFGARAGQAIFRFYCTATSEEDKQSVIASALFLGVALNGIGALFLFALSGPLAVAIFSDGALKSYIAFFAITLFLTPIIQIPLIFIRAQGKPWLFLAFSLGRLLLQVGLNIYFVVYREMHVEGVVYSTVISGGIMAALLAAYSLPQTGIRVTMAACKQIFSFSLPLKFAAIATFYLTFGDRYVLSIFGDLSQVGIYALGYKFGFIFTLIAWTPFEKMWDAQKYHIHSQPEARSMYQATFLYLNCTLIFIGLGISLFTRDLLVVMSDPAFLDAHKIVPIVILAYIFQAWSKFSSLGIYLESKTMQIAYAEFIAAGVITVAYFTLIPLFGIFGAAWATVVGFAARFYWTNKKAKQFYDMKLPWRKVNLTGLLAIVVFSLSFFAPADVAFSLITRLGLVILFLALFFALPILSNKEKREIFMKVRSLSSRFRRASPERP